MEEENSGWCDIPVPVKYEEEGEDELEEKAMSYVREAEEDGFVSLECEWTLVARKQKPIG